MTHLIGMVRRRFLVSYAVDPACLQPWVPPGAELDTTDGMAWLSACFVDMEQLRPVGVPARLGVSFRYLIHRTVIRLPASPRGPERAVLVLDASVDRRTVGTLARLTTGIDFVVRDIALTRRDDAWRLRMFEQGTLLFDVEMMVDAGTLDEHSRFADLDDAESALLGLEHGGRWVAGDRRLRLLPETHDPLALAVGRARTHTNVLVDGLVGSPTQADHVIAMADVPHRFGICPTYVDLSEAAAVAGSATAS